MAETEVTVTTEQGANTFGTMPRRDAEIVRALTEISGNIANVKSAPKSK